MKQRVLFLCSHNSARSQMAEEWLRHLGWPFDEVITVCDAASRIDESYTRTVQCKE